MKILCTYILAATVLSGCKEAARQSIETRLHGEGRTLQVCINQYKKDYGKFPLELRQAYSEYVPNGNIRLENWVYIFDGKNYLIVQGFNSAELVVTLGETEVRTVKISK